MDAQEIVYQIRENAQVFAKEPLRDGFATDATPRLQSTRILPQANKAYRRLIEKGIFQCWHRLTMTAGVASYRTSGEFTLVHQYYLEDVTGSVSKLTLTGLPQSEVAYREYFRDLSTGRPNNFVFTGNMIAFDALPDQAYKAYFLADSIPSDMVLPTDVPTALDRQYHDAIVTGGSVYIARMMLAAQEMNQGQVLLYKELSDEWKDYKQQILETNVSRVINVGTKPLMADPYRKGAVRLRGR